MLTLLQLYFKNKKIEEDKKKRLEPSATPPPPPSYIFLLAWANHIDLPWPCGDHEWNLEWMEGRTDRALFLFSRLILFFLPSSSACFSLCTISLKKKKKLQKFEIRIIHHTGAELLASGKAVVKDLQSMLTSYLKKNNKKEEEEEGGRSFTLMLRFS